MPFDIFNIIAIVYLVIGIFFGLVGVLAIVGGTFAFKRTNWALSLAGAIASSIAFFPCGIVAVILISLSKPEFSSSSTLSINQNIE